jgi:Na+-transporting methylmalonyl-CoA/oxaloacetate decarboxylase gamma subunit
LVAGNQDNDNHWPGYVDALTTMTMMLIFIMTILAVAIFGMSQNVSRSVVEKIARAANVETAGGSESLDDFAARVVAQLETGPPRDETTRLARASGDGPQPLRGTVAGEPGASGPAAGQRIVSSEQAKRADDAGNVRVDRGQAAITLAYQKRATDLDGEAQARIRQLMGEGAKGRLVIRAFADRNGAVSDARRVAFYRLIKLRSQMIALGYAADNIDFGIEDTSAPGGGDLVRINLAVAG